MVFFSLARSPLIYDFLPAQRWWCVCASACAELWCTQLELLLFVSEWAEYAFVQDAARAASTIAAAFYGFYTLLFQKEIAVVVKENWSRKKVVYFFFCS
jgi:hypothetical protein